MTVEPEAVTPAAGRSPSDTGRYEDFAKLRDSHLRMRESFSETVRVSGAVQAASQLREFLTRAQNTGAVLADPNVRKAAQGVLSYWSAELACLPNAKKEDALPILLTAPDPLALRAAGQTVPENDPAVDDKSDQRALIRLSATARQWRDSDREPGYLLAGNTIKEAARFADQDSNLAEFVTASEEGRKKRKRRIINATVVVSLLSLCGIFLSQFYALPRNSKSWIRQIGENTLSETQTNNLAWLATFQPWMPPYNFSGTPALANISFPGLRLYAPNFSGVKLSKVLLQKAQLPSASFNSSLILIEADAKSSGDRGFQWYDITSWMLRWSRGPPPDWTTVKWNDFSGADLSLAQFREAQIITTSFAGADLYRAVFDRALLCDVDFTNADLSKASFWGTTIDDLTYGWLRKTAWWVAVGWNSDDFKRLLRPESRDPAVDARALRHALRSSERFHTDVEVPILETRPGTFDRALALNDMAWALATWGIDGDELTPNPAPCNSTSLPKDALEAASQAICIIDDLKNKGRHGDYDYWLANLRDTQAYILMQANRMPEARALYEKDLDRTEADGGRLFRYAIALYATGQEAAAHAKFETAIREKEYLPSSELQSLKQYLPIKVLAMAYDLIDKTYPAARKVNQACPVPKPK